jgi:hypothetical protein
MTRQQRRLIDADAADLGPEPTDGRAHIRPRARGGIYAIAEPSAAGTDVPTAGAHDIYVDEPDLDRARGVLYGDFGSAARHFLGPL